MTQFNPEGKETLSYGESLEPAMEITDQEDADQYFADMVAYTRRKIDEDPEIDSDPEEVCRTNLGYFAGYYSQEVRKRVEKLFGAVHPYLGSVNKENTSEEIISTGIKIGREARKNDN